MILAGRDSYTFEAVDFFTNEPQEIGRLVLERDGVRWTLLACRAESTGGRWAGTWCGREGEDAHRLPRLELGPALVELLKAAPRLDPRTHEESEAA